MTPALDAATGALAGGVFAAMNAVGLLAFAVVGSLKAADADLDLLGVAIVGLLTALGGGVTRDVLVGSVPTALRSTSDVSLALLGVALAVVVVRRSGRTPVDHLAVTVPDAVGLAAFAATGALVGADAGLSGFGVVTLAALTGVGGGMVSDVLLDRVPFVLHEEFYATCAIAGGLAFWVGIAIGLAPGVGAVGCAFVTLGLRAMALRYDWALPPVGTDPSA